MNDYTLSFVKRLDSTLREMGFKPNFKDLDDAAKRMFPYEVPLSEDKEERLRGFACESLFTALVSRNKRAAFRCLLQARSYLTELKTLKVPVSYLEDCFTIAQDRVETVFAITDTFID
jgi:hypothetical protein